MIQRWIDLVFTGRTPLSVVRDAADILVVAYVIYRLLLVVRGTRALQVGVGLSLLALLYLAADRLGLTATYALLDRFITSFVLIVVVLFQADLRRALMRLGSRPLLASWRKDDEAVAVDEVVAAAMLLAQRKIGALIVFEREASLEDFVSQGTIVDAEISRDLLYATFLPTHQNPLHDGAVILRNARIWKAGTLLPLTNNPALERSLGTRHRAALGITEETDAVVVVVSEERGQVSLCFDGNIVRSVDAQSLRETLYGLFFSRQAQSLLRESQTAAQGERKSLPPPAPSRPPVPASPRTPGEGR